MKNPVLKTILPTVGISIFAALPTRAQVAITPSPLPELNFKAERKQVQQLRLRFVKPGAIAWWIDAGNHAAPPELGPDAAAHSPQIKLGFSLPAGVDRIVPIDAQNVILAFGTAEGIQQLREIIQFLDKPGDKILVRLASAAQWNVEARLVTIETDALRGIWAALSAQTGRATPPISLLNADEGLLLGEQVARREARFERTKNLVVSSGADRALDFGPVAFGQFNSPIFKDYRSQMPVIPPPETGDMPNRGLNSMGRLLPAPLGTLRFSVGASAGEGDSVTLQLREIDAQAILGRERSARFNVRQGETWALALPASTPGTSAFLLFSARVSARNATLDRIPLLGDLPMIGGLFRGRIAPQKTP